MANGLVKSIRKGLEERREHLIILKHKERDLVQQLVAVRRARKTLEANIKEDEGYLERIAKHS